MLMTLTPFPQLVMYIGFTLSFFTRDESGIVVLFPPPARVAGSCKW